MKKIFLIMILPWILSGTSPVNTNAKSPNTNDTPNLIRINQSYFIDGTEVQDSLELVNTDQKAIPEVTASSVSNWNMVSKNLEIGTLDFFYFDEQHYSYRQFAYDNETKSPANASTRAINNSKDEIECMPVQTYINSDGSTSLYTDGYDPENVSPEKEYSLMRAGIIGNDDRQLVNDPTKAPYKYAGFLVAKFNVQNNKTGKIDALYYGSTGFMEGPDLLITSGHSIYGDVTGGGGEYEDNKFNPRFADEIYYYPARNGNNVDPFGGVKVERAYLEKSYYQETKKDWACCKLATKIGNTTGWLGKISYFYKENYPIHTYGYPYSGNYRMYEASGKMTYFEEKENGWYYRTDIDVDGGQSGSPYNITLDNGQGYVCGIHTFASVYVDSGETAFTGGIRIDGFMFSFMNSFLTSESLYDIEVTDYGFADAYPTDEYTKNNFTIHNLSNGLTFRTRRYRTGYIHNEYIVMSPIRDNIPETKAFIEYSFKRPIEKMDVELSMWRSSEILTSSNGNAFLQIPGKNGWENQLDLLSTTVSLPKDRTQPKTYTIEFSRPVYNFRFYTEYYGTTFANGSNRGRICIGDMRLYFQRYNYMPLNWSELEYEPSKWSDSIEKNNNCYGYALNNQVYPGTNNLWYKQQPGEYAGITINECTEKVLVNAVQKDFSKYSADKNTVYKFEPIGKYDVCPEGTYKVALVCFKKGWWIFTQQDYHWYRQDSDGYWSHKQGTSEVKRFDKSDNLITDPETCDRGSYNNFIGYFAVTPWSNLYVA